MRKNNLTYLNVTEILDELQQDVDLEGKFKKSDILSMIKEGNLNAIREKDDWYVNKCDVSFFINSLKNSELYSALQYAGAIGIDLRDEPLEGRVLDIGGGGEGVIGQLKCDSIIAIDPSKRELEEAPPGPLKIQMDGKDLKFLDNTFDTVTSFFTLMYIPNKDLQNVFQEIYRVLKKSGKFLLWDLTIPQIYDKSKTIYSAFLEITLPNKTIYTGYGTRWDDKEQNLEYFCELGRSVGFSIIEKTALSKHAYKICFTKK